MNTPPAKPGFLSGFNLNSVLLLIVIILLGVVAFNLTPPEYEYRAWSTDRKTVSERGVENLPKGWEYVGILCPDGPDGAKLILRRPKP